MSQPPKYEFKSDFTKNHGSVQNDALLNAEFRNIEQILNNEQGNGLRDKIARILKDDDTLKNGIVGFDSLTQELKTQFEDYETQVAGATAISLQAKEDASNALTVANNARSIIDDANAKSEDAVSTADEAKQIATDADSKADSAIDLANSANESAVSASESAETALETANNASRIAQESITSVQNAINYDIPNVVAQAIAEENIEGQIRDLIGELDPSSITINDDETSTGSVYSSSKTQELVSSEAEARQLDVSTLQESLDAETQARQSLDTSLATVAKTGSYSDLTQKPSIPTVPTNVSAFTNDANYTSKTYVDEAIAGVDALPSQTGQSGKFLGTDGTEASWVSPPSGRNLHEWVWSALPLTDAGLHLADGAFIPFGGVYDKWARDVERIKNAGLCPDAFVTQAEFDASVSAYGSCGKFVVTADGVRLPKVSDILQGTTDLSAVGDLVEAGLPNITGQFFGQGKGTTNSQSIVGGTGAFSKTETASLYIQGSSNYWGTLNPEFDASLSSPYYRDDIQKPTPQTIKSLLYICVATSVKTPVEANIDNIATDMNNKADKDFANVTKPYIVEMGENSAGWWKILSNGWVEQGGILLFDSSTGKEYTVQLPVEMRDADYNCRCSTFASTYKTDSTSANRNTASNYVAFPFSKTVTSFGTRGTTAEMNILGLSWEVKGWKA